MCDIRFDEQPSIAQTLASVFNNHADYGDYLILANFGNELCVLTAYEQIANKQLFFETIVCCAWTPDIVVCMIRHIATIVHDEQRRQTLAHVIDRAAELSIIMITLNTIITYDILRRDIIIQPAICKYLATFLRIYVSKSGGELGIDFASMSFVVAFFQQKIIDCAIRLEDGYTRDFVFRAYRTFKRIPILEFQNMRTGMSCDGDVFEIPFEWYAGYGRSSICSMISAFGALCTPNATPEL